MGVSEHLGIVNPACRNQGACGQQDVDVAEHLVDISNHLPPTAPGLHVVPGRQERAGHQPLPAQSPIIPRPRSQPRRMNGPDLAVQDHPADSGEFRQWRQCHRANVCAFVGQDRGNLLKRRHHFRVSGQVSFVEVPDKAHAQTTHPMLKIIAKSVLVRSDTAAVVRIVPGDDIQQQGGIGGGPCHRANMINRERERGNAGAGDARRSVSTR